MNATMATETPQQAARRLSAGAFAKGFRPDGFYPYTDANGEPLFYRFRLKHPETGEKWIRPMRLDEGEFVVGEPAFPNGKPLYRLHEIAGNPDAPVLVAEGENCADALAKLGLVATTSGGASSAAAADWTPLAGREVMIWPDNDPPGQQYGSDVAERLASLGCTVSVIDVAALGLAPKGDCVDWLAAHPGAKAADVRALPVVAEACPSGEAWPAITPLPDARLAVPAFNLELLPEALRPWIEDIAERLQCPPDFPAVGAMVSLAAVVGRRIGIRPKARDDWTVVPNLWGAIVGRPGVLKTPALAEAMRPLERLAAKAREAHAEAMREHAGRAELAKARKDTLRAELRTKKERRDDAAILADLRELAGQDTPPVEVRYLTNDPTVEKLGELLAANPAGVLVFRDELTGWLRSLDREGREGDRSFYLEAWNGTGAYTYDRIGRGTLHIEAATVSVLGGIQPGPLASYVREAAGDGRGADGLLQRFQLLVWPDDPAGWRNVDKWPDTAGKNAAFEVFERLAGLDPLAVGGRDDDGLPYLRFDPAAQEAFDDWRHDLEDRLRRGEPESIEAHLAKYRSLVPSLALLCHLADNPHGGPVTLAAMLRAADWCEYLEAHARRLYAPGLDADCAAAHALAAHIRRGDVPDGSTPRDIHRKDWSGLGTTGETYAALRVLADCGWLRLDQMVTGGRPSVVIRLNPRLEVTP